MSITRKIFFLLLALLSIVFLPYLGSLIHFSGNFPESFFQYPPLQAREKEEFNLFVFIAIAIAFVGVAAFYLLPQWFGFKKVEVPPRKPVKKVYYPRWFWLGLVMWGSAVFLLWGKFRHPAWFLHWSDLPLFWGFTLIVDGMVFKRTGGKSIISHVPQELLGIGVASMSGWMVFEFLNFFVEENWFYPKGNIIDREQFLLYAIIGSTGLMPLAFEWYSYLSTFPKLRVRYSNGWKFKLPEWAKTVGLILALVGLFGAGLFPQQLFFSLWLSPLILLAIVLDKVGVWTPFKSIGTGNWTPVLLFALTYLIEGLLLEGQNYLSGIHRNGEVVFTEAPAYWVYSLPYVNVLHVFEMPLLGFLGYLPFGLYCWIWWITCATLLKIPSRFYKEEMFEVNT